MESWTVSKGQFLKDQQLFKDYSIQVTMAVATTHTSRLKQWGPEISILQAPACELFRRQNRSREVHCLPQRQLGQTLVM